MATSVPMSQQTTLHATDEYTTSLVLGRDDIESGRRTTGDRATSNVAARSTDQASWHAADKKYPGSGTHADPYVVDWELGDAENPFNWSRARKWAITGQVRRLQLRLQAADQYLLIDAMLLSLILAARYINFYGVLL